MKRFITLFLVFIMCLSSLVSVSAAEQNLVPEGSFNSKSDLRIFSQGVTKTAQWSEEGATKTPGSVQFTIVNAEFGTGFYVMTLVGETYDISFYAKCTGVADGLIMYAGFRDGGGFVSIPFKDSTVTNDWHKFEATWTVPKVNSQGNEVTGPCSLIIRTNNPKGVEENLWIDELKVVPHGNVSAHYTDRTAGKGGWEDPVPAEKELSAVKFTDIENHWAAGILDALASNGYVNGMGDGTYCPDNDVTRAEFITLVMNSFNLTDAEYKNAYTDVTKDAYFASNLQIASQLKIINPAITPAKKFSPEKAITRQEAASILWGAVKAKGSKKANDSAVNFKDEADIAQWAKEDVMNASSLGLVTGYETGEFKPEGKLTRAEAATMLLRLIELDNRMIVFVDSKSGNDDNNGTFSAPVASVEKAKEIVRNEKGEMQHNIYVLMAEGEYFVDKTLEFTKEDSGENGYNIIYTSKGDEKPVIMQGKNFSDFSLYDAEKNIYRVYTGGLDARQVYFNGVRGVRARSEGHIGLANCTIDKELGGHTTTDTFIADFKYPTELEMVYMVHWMQPRGQVEKIEVKDDLAYITMDPDWWPLVVERGATHLIPPKWYENAYELLDNPGEWYLNTHDGFLYYKPRHYEDMSNMVATVPVGERMITMTGTADEKVHNITFDNVQFSYTSWMQPSESGVADSQNCILAGTGHIEAAIRTTNVQYVDFLNCTFSKMGAVGLQMFGATQDCNIIGNEFYDISSNAVMLGETSTVDGKAATWRENILPVEYKHYIVNNKINNNYIHDVALDYGSSAGISASYPKDTEISHNEIGNMIYSGMHIGWGWNTYETTGTATYNFNITENYVYNVCYDEIADGGPIYTIGATGGNSEHRNVIGRNYLLAHQGIPAYVYTDNGSTYWSVEENVMDTTFEEQNPLWLGEPRKDTAAYYIYDATQFGNRAVNNYHNTKRLECVEKGNWDVNVAEGNVKIEEGEEWPAEAKEIMANAGIEPEYSHLIEGETIRAIRGKYEIEIDKGETKKMEVNLLGRKELVYDLPENTYYVSSNPEIATVDADGNITAVGSGIVEVYAYVPVKDRVLYTYTRVLCTKDIKEISFGRDVLHLVEGVPDKLGLEVLTYADKIYSPDSVEFSADDESIVAYDAEAGNIIPLKEGSTTVHITAKLGQYEKTASLPVNVIKMTNADAVNYELTPLDSSFFKADMWRRGDARGQTFENGINVVKASLYNQGHKYEGLINFDLVIDETNPTGGWPSLALLKSGTNYSDGDMYLFGFDDKYFELQRFNKGERTVLFGYVSGFESEVGRGIPIDGIFEYGKKHNITFGTIDMEDGVHVILNVDGKNVFEYVDNSDKKIPGGYYPYVYATSATFSLTPASGN